MPNKRNNNQKTTTAQPRKSINQQRRRRLEICWQTKPNAEKQQHLLDI
jgi:hypothetical protein